MRGKGCHSDLLQNRDPERGHDDVGHRRRRPHAHDERRHHDQQQGEQEVALRDREDHGRKIQAHACEGNHPHDHPCHGAAHRHHNRPLGTHDHGARQRGRGQARGGGQSAYPDGAYHADEGRPKGGVSPNEDI